MAVVLQSPATTQSQWRIFLGKLNKTDLKYLQLNEQPWKLSTLIQLDLQQHQIRFSILCNSLSRVNLIFKIEFRWSAFRENLHLHVLNHWRKCWTRYTYITLKLRIWKLFWAEVFHAQIMLENPKSYSMNIHQ